MRPNPMMAELRQRLGAMGVEWRGEDVHNTFDSGYELHVDRTYTPVGMVTYSWARDVDGNKRGDSRGWPAYLELQGDDPVIVTVDEVCELCAGQPTN